MKAVPIYTKLLGLHNPSAPSFRLWLRLDESGVTRPAATIPIAYKRPAQSPRLPLSSILTTNLNDFSNILSTIRSSTNFSTNINSRNPFYPLSSTTIHLERKNHKYSTTTLYR